MRPLEDILVLDFSTLLPGPMATLMLAEAGAEVIKVERPDGGDPMRAYAPAWGRDGANFALLNRGKKSLVLDLKDKRDRAKLDPLIEKADVLVEQFRPGVMKRLGLDYEALSAINPKLVYCSISGYGQAGPMSQVAGHDLNYIGDVGLLSLSYGDAERPVVPPALVADIAAGAHPAFSNILLALLERGRTGRGRHLDIAIADNLFHLVYWALAQGLVTGEWPGNGDGLVTGGTPRYRLYTTRDRRLVAAAPIEQKFWDNFCEAVGLERAFRDDSLDPAETIRRLGAIIGSRDAEEWRNIFAGTDCAASVVATLEEAMASPHFAARGLFSRSLVNERGDRLPALPVPLDPGFRGDPSAPLSAPGLGEGGDKG